MGDQDAEDIVQEAYLQMLQNFPKDPLQNARAYLFRITANVTVDHFRRAKCRIDQISCPLTDELDRPEGDTSIDATAGYELRRAIEKLPVKIRQALMLRIEGYNAVEIGRRLGVSPRTIERYLHKTMNDLKE